MKQQNIYLKDINRYVNPVVSASDFDDETVKVEIDEYVFTDEIIRSLYTILNEVRLREFNHNGIWINGYFGSGKSHFLKFLNYLVNPKYSDKAVARLTEAVKLRDPLSVMGSKTNVTISDMEDLALWLKKATIDTIHFNIETVSDSYGDQNRVFLDVFWNQFNRFRGYNNLNLPLAQYFEKKLDDYGKLNEFKQRIAAKGYDWDTESNTLAITELDEILAIGKELVPQLATDQIRKAIEEGSFVLSVETFMNELKAYLKNKDENYRLVFLVDEVSQFIDDRKGLLLQLQTIVEELHKYCEDKIWVACTAQQDLSQILQACNINQTAEDYGKIMGRFEVKVSLKGIEQEYITQKRILEKTAAAEIELGKLYDAKQNALAQQFHALPNSYKAYESRQQFIDFYPFVPYQFSLMTNIFESFVSLGYVDLQVRGSNRSIIQVTHDTAKGTANEEVGGLVSFDQFYNGMFANSLTAKGDSSIHVATVACEKYEKPDFALRVVRILFMICNMNDTYKATFKSTVENITTLLMRNIDSQKLALKQEVETVLDFLCENNIIHKETAQDGVTVFYDFYSDDERQVADRIKNLTVDQDTLATQLKEILFGYLLPQNRVSFETSNFSIGATINGKNFLANNPDIVVEFITDSEYPDANAYALNNDAKRLVFFMAKQHAADNALRNNFYWYCQVQKYINENRASDEKRQRTYREFAERANTLKTKEITTALLHIFDTCPVISGHSVITLDASKGKNRYLNALQEHFSNIYSMAKLVSSSSVPTTSDGLRKSILRPINPNDYGPLNPLTKAEEKVEDYLNRQFKDVNMKDVVNYFSNPPYGWNPMCTVYVVNELVRRHKREFTYNNNGNIEPSFVAANIMSELAKFAVCPAQAIPMQLVNDFVNAWNEVFGIVSLSSNSDTTEIVRQCKDFLETAIAAANDDGRKIASYPFNAQNDEAIELLQNWKLQRDPVAFFTEVVTKKDAAKAIIDRRKIIHQFVTDKNTFDTYRSIRAFVSENQDNWQYLDRSNYNDVSAITEIMDDIKPFENLRVYVKLRKSLEAQFDALKGKTREQIRKSYSDTYQQLVTIAAENSITYDLDIEGLIQRKTQSENLLALLNNIDTNDFYTTESAKLLERIKAKQTPPPQQPNGGSSGGSSDPKPQPYKVKQVKLNTRTAKVIKTKADVDAYLETIRKQLQSHLDNGEEIMII